MSNARFSIMQGKAVCDRRITDSIFRTLSALGMYSDKDGWCFPKQSTLADDVGKSRQTVNEHIGLLVKWGYLEKRDRFREDGSQTASLYRLLFDTPVSSLETTPPVTPRNDSNNDPYNDPYNTASSENQLSAMPLSIENQIYVGRKDIVMPDEKESQYVDTANLIATGMGINGHMAYGIAYTFMYTRQIAIPRSKIKGQRKAIKEMMDMGVLPHHVEEATKNLMDKGLTVVDLYSISKTAIALANPAAFEYNGAVEGV